jgi:hypothetical protein
MVEDDPLLRGVVRILRHRAGAFRRIPDVAPDRVTGQMLTFRNDRLWRKADTHKDRQLAGSADSRSSSEAFAIAEPNCDPVTKCIQKIVL